MVCGVAHIDGKMIKIGWIFGGAMTWRLRDAKNRFHELFTRALSEGPQRVRHDNGTVVVVIAEQEFRKLTASYLSFKDFLLGNGPSLKGVDLKRDSSAMHAEL
jgi:hypothetical protein